MLIIFISLLFEGTRVREYHERRARLLARYEILNTVHVQLALFQLFLPCLFFRCQPLLKRGLLLSLVACKLGHEPRNDFFFNFFVHLLLTSFFSCLSDMLIQPYHYFVQIIVVHR